MYVNYDGLGGDGLGDLDSPADATVVAPDTKEPSIP